MIEELIIRITPHRDKLLKTISKSGIEFISNDGMNNVVFKLGDKEVKISHHCFYRVSGLSRTRKDISDHEFIQLPVTDDMFMNTHMRLILMELHFFPKLKTIKKDGK